MNFIGLLFGLFTTNYLQILMFFYHRQFKSLIRIQCRIPGLISDLRTPGSGSSRNADIFLSFVCLQCRIPGGPAPPPHGKDQGGAGPFHHPDQALLEPLLPRLPYTHRGCGPSTVRKGKILFFLPLPVMCVYNIVRAVPLVQGQ